MFGCLFLFHAEMAGPIWLKFGKSISLYAKLQHRLPFNTKKYSYSQGMLNLIMMAEQLAHLVSHNIQRDRYIPLKIRRGRKLFEWRLKRQMQNQKLAGPCLRSERTRMGVD